MICSENYGDFDLIGFGYMRRSLTDLTTVEDTLEQRVEKLQCNPATSQRVFFSSKIC